MAASPARGALLALLLALTTTSLGAEPIRFARYPNAAHGLLAFSYHGDIWIAQQDGSAPRRLTAHVGRDVHPRFSPDGRWVAFSSNRYGNDDVFVVATAGGEPRQLTFHSANDQVLGWTPGGTGIVFSTSRGRNPWGTPLHIVNLGGGLPLPMGMDVASAGMIRQDGTAVAFNRKPFSYWRKGYRGNRSTDVYVQDLETKTIRQLTDIDIRQYEMFTQDALPMWGVDGLVYFLSERDGTFNLWRIPAEGGEPEQVTRHRGDGVQYPSISPDGRTIVYENDFDLWLLDVAPGAEPRRITVDLSFDAQQSPVHYLTARSVADGFSVAPDGDHLAVDFHGEIFRVPVDPELGEKARITRSPWRQRAQLHSPDGKWLAYVSDETREEEVWVQELATGERRRLSTHESVKSELAWSPDSRRLAFVAANGLWEADVGGGEARELSHNPAGGYRDVGYAPGGDWLVYTRGDDDLDLDVYLFEIGSRREIDVTRNPFRDGDGTVTPDGGSIVFTSTRDGGTNHLFVAPLPRLDEDPDDPLVKARLAAAEEGRGGNSVPELRVEPEGIERRAVQITRGSSGVGDFFLSQDGETVYFTSDDDDGPGLFSVGIGGQDRKKVVGGTFLGITPTADRKVAFYLERGDDGNELWKLTLHGAKKERVAFELSLRVDRRAEWEQIFEESWRVMKYRFYDEDMHGVDWNAMRERYRPLLAWVGSNEDVYDLANEMIGELNASHTGVSGPPSLELERPYTTRQLGLELAAADGRYRIEHIYRNGPADREWLGLSVGDYVLAIDGVELEAGDNYWEVLNHALNEYVPVRVAEDARGTAAREVRIRTLPSINAVRYEEWVEKNREFVDRESDGQLAYVHIQAMNQPSLRKFENEIERFWNKRGIVVDIRYNGGGNIDQQLIDILERRPYEYWNNRWGSRVQGRRPRQAIAGPKVMLINWRSASDSEVTPQAFRDLELGRIVGNPTSAAVIATGSYALINGGRIRTPGSLVVTYDPIKPNNYGINLENFGVAPDVFVVNSPEDELDGFDRELKTAVDEALRMLASGTWQYKAVGG